MLPITRRAGFSYLSTIEIIMIIVLLKNLWWQATMNQS